MAVGTATAVVVAPTLLLTSALADDVALPGDSAAHGHGLFVEGLGLDVAGVARSEANSATAPGPSADDLDARVLEGLVDLNLGTVELPLITPTEGGDGLLYLGDLGTMSSRAAAASPTNAVSSSGIINEDGSLNLDTAAGSGFEPARLNVTQLLGQVLGADAVEELVSGASLEIGALGARAAKDGSALTSEYVVSDLELDVDSPLVEALTSDVDTAVAGALQPVVDLVGTEGAVETAVADVVSTIDALPLVTADLGSLSVDTQSVADSVRTELLAEPLANAEGSVSVNLADGTITVDLAQIVIDSAGVQDLNELPANTEVLSGPVVNAVLDGVSDALVGPGENSLVSKTVDLVTEGVYDAGLDVAIDVSAGPGVTAPVTVNGTLGGFLGQAGAAEPTVDVDGLSALGIDLSELLTPITGALTGLVGDLGAPLEPAVDESLANVQPTLTTALAPLVTDLLDDALKPLLEQVLAVRINEQPTAAPINGSGDLGAGSFTVRALSVDVLPAIAGVGIELGSASVRALDE
ncbi:MAG: choice-of-anchor G family protein, partial [Aeromicrobium sp.]